MKRWFRCRRQPVRTGTWRRIRRWPRSSSPMGTEIRRGATVDRIENRSVASTVAALLNMKLPAAESPAPAEILTR